LSEGFFRGVSDFNFILLYFPAKESSPAWAQKGAQRHIPTSASVHSQLQEGFTATCSPINSSTDPSSISPRFDNDKIAVFTIFRLGSLEKHSITSSQIFYYCRNTAPLRQKTMKFSPALLLIAAASQHAVAFAPTTSSARSVTFLNSVLTKVTGRSSLDPAVIARYDALPFPSDTILAEYVWVDADGNTRSKTRTLPAAKAENVESLPKWNFDGSSTGQAPGDDSEVILRPCRIFKDPFRPRSDDLDNILVMCDTWTPAGEPLPTNSRAIGTSLGSCFERRRCCAKAYLKSFVFYPV
jgi:hypothetical protein